MAQAPSSNWIKLLNTQLPKTVVPKNALTMINSWQPGQPVPLQLLPSTSHTSPPPPPDPPSHDSPNARWPCPVCDFIANTGKGLRTHYDQTHTPQDPIVTTVFHSKCSLCGIVFVTARDARFHKCPSKPQHVDDIPVAKAIPPPLENSLNQEPLGWAIYTDGSGPCEGHPFAGWGVAIWESRLSSPIPDFGLWGPVPLEQWDARWMGARVATNNTGELTAIIEALIWLRDEAPGPSHLPATIWFDSTYAHHAITGSHQPDANQELIDKARSLFHQVLTQRPLEWRKVKAHAGNNGNEHAEHLAKKGSKGSQTPHSTRWSLPVGSPTPSDPLNTDFCWRCGQVYSGPSYARQLAGHERGCKVPGPPPPHIPCRKLCGKTFSWRFPTPGKRAFHHAREYRNMHESICRGSTELTLTCPFCEKNLENPSRMKLFCYTENSVHKNRPSRPLQRYKQSVL